jgi:IclR family pca regulon transcriptional regulator
MGVGLHAGSRLPAYCTAMGRVLLAALPPDHARQLLEAGERPQVTDKTITDVDELMAELRKVAGQGYALIDGELEAGSRAVAVPLRNITGETVAAVNVASPSSRLTDQRLHDVVLPALRDMQSYLSEILP